VEITNPDRIVFPDDGITKGDVVDHYATVAGHMLDFVAGRALTVERYPRGIGEKGFMQKNVPAHAPDELIARFEVPKEGGGTTVYPVVDDPDGIVFFANLGVITFHAPAVTVDDETHPDWVIWDLDPPEGGTDLVRKAAHRMREVLESFAIDTRPMTSGSKGYHLRARLDKSLDGESVAVLARGVAALAAAAADELLTVAFRKADRGDRVFVDWLRNAPRSTSVVPWSLRARPGAPVAVPLAWDQVDEVAPDGVRMHDAPSRLDRAPWSGLEPQDLREALARVEAALEEAGIALEPFDRFRP
jgi:bifunctional non-homologous end joining protein LigD